MPTKDIPTPPEPAGGEYRCRHCRHILINAFSVHVGDQWISTETWSTACPTAPEGEGPHAPEGFDQAMLDTRARIADIAAWAWQKAADDVRRGHA